MGEEGGVGMVKDGLSEAVVVLGDGVRAGDLAVTALVSAVKEISGATLPVFTKEALSATRVQGGRISSTEEKVAGATYILLGESDVTRALGLSTEGLGAGGIVVETRGNALALLAKDDGGGSRTPPVARAVFRLLEELACRYLWPGEGGKGTPRMATIRVPELRVRFTPPIGQRNIRVAPAEARDAAKALELDVK
jgi:hypothetical protein